MLKNNEVQPETTLCDWCTKPAVTFSGLEAFCNDHAMLIKKASKDEAPLKSFAVKLASQHAK